MTPRPHQLTGAAFLADRRFALLADEPRVGKTGAAITACDLICAESVLVVTTASGRAVWRKAFREWSTAERVIQIVGWSEVSKAALQKELQQRRWAVLVLDESHYAKNMEAARTEAVYGPLGLARIADRVWCLTGTPVPNAPNDLWPMLSVLASSRVKDTPTYEVFLDRYCIVRKKRLSRWKSIDVVIAGKNEAELNGKLHGFMLRRTQGEIGITEPIYETLPLRLDERTLVRLRHDIDVDAAMRAARRGDANALEQHMGPVRRLTGGAKARAVSDLVIDEQDCGAGKTVLMFWHTSVGEVLRKELNRYAPVILDGATTAPQREAALAKFNTDDKCRVFLAQIQAAGEAIDLSAANELIFVEASFIPKDMKQAALRITNMTQQRQPRVRVAVLEGSIDEAVQEVLLRKWSSIKEVLK